MPVETLTEQLEREQALLNAPEVSDPTVRVNVGGRTAGEGEGDSVIKASQEQPLPARVSQHTGIWVPFYNTRTNEQFNGLRWNVAEALKKKHKDRAYPEWLGKPLFKVGFAPKPAMKGAYPCHLSPTHPDWPRYEALGMKACLAAHLASPQEVQLHLERHHKSEWAGMERARVANERQEGLDLQRQQTAALIRLASGQASPASPVTGQPETVTLVSCGCGGQHRPGGKTLHERSKHHREWATKQAA